MSQILSESKLKEYYEVALDLVKKCGPIMQAGFEKDKIDYQIKAEFNDFVTEYDKRIEDMLTEGLLKAFPESLIIGEEGSAASKRQPELTDAPTWIIDPIDGTTNFIQRIPNCCISVGLAVNKELVVGIIYNPPANELYSARKGHGAYLNGQRIKTSKATTISQAVLVIPLFYTPGLKDKNLKRLYKLGPQAKAMRCFGSAALTLCYVATGRCDACYVDDLQPWDLAAGAVILTEAGGIICHIKGGKFNVMKPHGVCASTQELADNIISLIEEANQITEYTFR